MDSNDDRWSVASPQIHMSTMAGLRVKGAQGMRSPAPAEGYVKEFMRHSDDVLLNLNELRHRNILTDTTLVVGTVHLRAHCAVLVACSGFFYTLYTRRVLLQGRGEQLMTVSLPNTLDPSSISLLLDFMYTSRLPLTPSTVPGVLTAATYLQMDHVVDTAGISCSCTGEGVSVASLLRFVALLSVDGVSSSRHFLVVSPSRVPADVRGFLTPGAFPTSRPGSRELKEPEVPLVGSPTVSPDSPARSSCQPNSPAQSNTCNKNLSDPKAAPDPKACNWKKYKYIVLNPLCAATAVKEEEMEEAQSPTSPGLGSTPKATEAWSGEVPGQIDSTLPPTMCLFSKNVHVCIAPNSSVSPCAVCPNLRPTDPEAAQRAVKHENCYVAYCYSGNVQGTKSVCSGEKPYRCNVCGAQFNRPANLKTHSRIHSGEKPYRCDTCGSRFVQVAHLRAHVLIHTGEKPYPCHTCGTRFRHLQTLKSHLRIHTGEKPYTCEKCDLHFRHKSQLRLHLRQKHGAVTNTKVRYKVLTEPYQTVLQAC
uniref:BCL6B transcription repressor n=1 Tax=Gasterosteus aculeatus aculeatus TaxID=481459 RepID=G3Q6R4_GASAC